MANGYTITIKAVDKATGVFDALNKSAEALAKRVALARAPFDRLSASFGKFAKTTGLDKIATGFADVAKGATETFRSMLRVLDPLSAITSAASLVGLYRLADAWGEVGSKLLQQSIRAGLSANALQGLQNAARLAGVDAETLTQGMTSLNDNMRNAAFGGAPQFIQALQALGLRYDDIKKKTPQEALEIFADKIAAIKNPTDQALVATALFGAAAEGLLPFLRQGAKGIEYYRLEAVRLGRQLGQQGVIDANNFSTAQTKLRLATEGVANALGDKLAVVLTPLLEQFATWLGTSPGVTHALEMAGIAAGEFADYLRGIDWTAIGQDIKAIAEQVEVVVHALGGWKAAGLDILRFMVLVWAAPMAFSIIKIGALLAGIPGKAAAAAAAANVQLGAVGTGAAGLGLLAFAALLSTLALKGDTDGKKSPDAITPEDAQGRVDRLNEGTGYNGGFFHDLGVGIGHLFGGGRDSGGTKGIPPGIARDNAKAMADVFQKEGGYTQEGAAAMLGASYAESGNNTDPAHNNEGRGAFQWSPKRRTAIYDNFHKDILQMNAAEQARAVLWEMQTRPEFANLNRQLRTSHDLSTNNAGITQTFEAPADIPGQIAARMPMSRGALAQIQHDAAPSGMPPIPPPASPSGLAAPAAPAAPAADPASAAAAAAGRPSGDPVSGPTAASLGGAPGANGTVKMNVTVRGAAKVSTVATGGVNVETRNIAKDGF